MGQNQDPERNHKTIEMQVCSPPQMGKAEAMKEYTQEHRRNPSWHEVGKNKFHQIQIVGAK